MSHIHDMTAAEVVHWMVKAKVPSIPVDVFLTHGVDDTAVIAKHYPNSDVVDLLPKDVLLLAEDVPTYLAVGPVIWMHDNENAGDWAAASKGIDDLDRLLEEHWYDHPRWSGRTEPDGSYRSRRDADDVRGRDTVTALYEAGRGPSYAQAILPHARKHLTEIDAYGFDDAVTPTVYRDLAEAGIRNRAALRYYERAGLTLAEAVQYASDGVPPGAVMLAAAQGIPKAEWPDLLPGLPARWFKNLASDDYGDEQNIPAKGLLTNSHKAGDDFSLRDLHYLAEHGFHSTLGTYSIPDLTMDHLKALADNGLDIDDVKPYVDALMQGKAPRDSRDTTVGPLIGWGGGRGGNRLKAEHLGGVIQLRNAGIRATHLLAYRQAGCKSVTDVLHLAVGLDVNHKRVKALLAEHGRKPSTYHSTRLLTYEQTIRLAQEGANA